VLWVAKRVSKCAQIIWDNARLALLN